MSLPAADEATRPLRLDEVEFIAFDVETTGLYPAQGDRIVEIGALRFKVQDDAIVELGEFSTLINPGRPVGDSFNVHGISDLELVSAPDEKTAIDAFVKFIAEPANGPAFYFLAHNAPFDKGFLDDAMRRHYPDVYPQPWVCTLRMSSRYIPYTRSRRLPFLAERFQIPTGTSHRALDDARTASRVFLEFRKMRKLATLVPELVLPHEFV